MTQPTPHRVPARPRKRSPGTSADLSEMLCFDLYAASRAVTSVYRVLLEGLGVTYPQYLVLVVLWREGPCQVKELAQRLHLDYGTLTPLLRRMEAAQLVTRRRRLEDERTVEIALTTTGSALEEPARALQPAIQAAFGLSREDAIALQLTLRHVTESARRSTEGLVDHEPGATGSR